MFGLAGLAIEARETPDFPACLDPRSVEVALRYFPRELNGFPFWFEALYRAHPQASFAAVWRELEWELRTTTADAPLHYVLHDLLFYAPWLHADLAPPLLSWLGDHDAPEPNSHRYIVQILRSGGVTPARLSELARNKLHAGCPDWQRPRWFAEWASGDPESGIPAIKRELARIRGRRRASRFAQEFVVALVGGRGNDSPALRIPLSPEQLKRLYVLMHRYIRVEDDIERAGKGVYSPELRDDAQDARNHLFKLLSETPGKPTYVALRSLAVEHPSAGHRPWMLRHARDRAVEDADLPAMDVAAFRDFADAGEVAPRTHRELFDLAVARIGDMRDWLENGDDSPAKTWARAEDETKLRNLVAGWLEARAHGRYSRAQEPELANAQRPDIWLQRPAMAPVPIELKLLERWTGPKLCERLRNQLAGDYLRARDATCGIFLLVWRGDGTGKRWEIDGKPVALPDLAAALRDWWSTVAAHYPGVDAIEIVVIDLTARAPASGAT